MQLLDGTQLSFQWIAFDFLVVFAVAVAVVAVAADGDDIADNNRPIGIE